VTSLDAEGTRKLVDEVPNFEHFMLVEELENSSRELAKKYPAAVEWRVIGQSSEDRPITALVVGESDESVLLYGFTHPNEPIGALTVEYLASRLAASPNLRKQLGYRVVLVKAVDVDGAKLNEGWFRGPFDPLTYSQNYYRPPPNEQAEWTFPIDYKTLHWNTPIPETQAIKKAVDEFKPAFTYILHNADFCGVYYYLSHPLPSAYAELKRIPISEGLPLHLGEPPDEPYLQTLDEGIYHDYGVSDEYEFLSTTLNADPATKINYGTDCYEYIRNKYHGFSFTCELPHFYDISIEDTIQTQSKRRDLFLGSLKIESETQELVRRIVDESHEFLDLNSRIFRAVQYFLDRWTDLEQTMLAFSKDSAFDRPATVAEKFDLTVLRRFSQMPILGMLERLLKEAEARTGHQKLRQLHNETHSRLLHLNDTIMQESRPQPIPPRTLVRIQLQSALTCLKHFDSNRP
jgi:hypothetical protein